jgi:hypothetical protein
MFNYPSDLWTVRGDPESELSYDEWCTQLAEAGCNFMRINLAGTNSRIHRKVLFEACSIEPPPAGTYNVWKSALDPRDLAQYRAEQIVPGTPRSAWWNQSNLGSLIDAAEQHGIKFSIVPFAYAEFRRDWWRYHAWNANNYYVSGERCVPADRGWLQEARELFTDTRAIQAAKDRLTFICDAFEGHDVIGAWELWAEMTWMVTNNRDVWGIDAWDGRMITNVREKVVPWVEEMLQHIKTRSSAPAGNGQAFIGRRTDYPDHPDNQVNVRNEIHGTPSSDVVWINWYHGTNYSLLMAQLRAHQAHWPDKQIVVEQTVPYNLNRDEPWREESSPFQQSKILEWLLVCGEYGCVGPIRWMGIYEENINWWRTGGYADPAMAEIAGVTEAFAQVVDPASWQDRGGSWDERISSPDLSLISSWGSSEHVTMFLSWPSAGDHAITVTGLKDQSYTFYLFDWITGELLNTQDVAAEEGTLTLDDLPDREGRLAGYLVAQEQDEPVAELVLPTNDGFDYVLSVTKRVHVAATQED